jgi:hypothetical protein
LPGRKFFDRDGQDTIRAGFERDLNRLRVMLWIFTGWSFLPLLVLVLLIDCKNRKYMFI